MLRNETDDNDIIESNNIRDMLKLVQFDSWVIWDIDNTIMESQIELGGDAWFTQMLALVRELHEDSQEAAAMVVEIYHAVQHHTMTKPVESIVVKIIRALQDIGLHVLALTARDHVLNTTTFRQLADIGVDFSHKLKFSQKKYIFGEGENAFTFDSGIIFCGGKDKGTCLKTFLEYCVPQPKHITRVEDKPKYLKIEKEAISDMPIVYSGLRYSNLDKKIQEINMGNAHVQLALIKHKLPSSTQKIIEKLEILPDEIKIEHHAYLEKIYDPNKKGKQKVGLFAEFSKKDKDQKCEHVKRKFKLD